MLLNGEQVLQTDSELSFLIVPRLIRYTMTWKQLIACSLVDPNSALVDTKEAADAVTGAVAVVLADLEEMAAGKDVDVFAGVFSVFGPHECKKLTKFELEILGF